MTETTSQPTETNTFKPDLSLVRDMSSATPADKDNFKRPHLTHYTKDNKHLYYLGVKHGKDFETRSHDMIMQAMFKHKPQLIVIEGLATEAGISPSFGFDKKMAGNFARFLNHEENIHTAEFARSKKIPFIGGEPSTKEIFEALGKQGYSDKESMAVYLLRNISVWRRKGLLNQGNLRQQAEMFLLKDPVFKHIPAEDRLTFDEFTAWYDSHKHELRNKNLLDVVASDTNYNGDHAPNYFQRMTKIMDRVRDEHLVNVIADCASEYDKVMVVYGNAHQFASEPVFEKMFGGKAQKEMLVLNEVAAPAPQVAPQAPVQKNDNQTPPEKASSLPKWLKYGSIALLGAGITTLTLGAAPLVTAALLVGSGVAFTGSKATEARQQPPATVPEAADNPPSPTTVEGVAPAKAVEQSPARKDGKSWVASSSPPPAEQQLPRSL
jgi:hypothetical protein